MRFKTILIAMVLLMSISAMAQPSDGIGISEPVFPKPTADSGVFVRLGWYNTTQAWFICTATNNIAYTENLNMQGGELTLAPKLSSALVPKVPGGDIAARPVYMVTNFQNPPVFSAVPGQALYSALWQVFNVTWKRGVKPRPITSADPASPSNPTGLPDSTQANIVATQVVLDCPILVLGLLTQPFPTNGSGYIIPQGGVGDPYLKVVFLPFWAVYCEDPVTKRVNQVIVRITDVGDPALASVLGANYAPGLLNLPDSDTTDFYVMREPKPLTQLPVVGECPAHRGLSDFNYNYNYSPVMKYTILKRNIPPYALVKSADYLRFLLSNGGLELLKNDQRINAQVLGPG